MSKLHNSLFLYFPPMSKHTITLLRIVCVCVCPRIRTHIHHRKHAKTHKRARLGERGERRGGEGGWGGGRGGGGGVSTPTHTPFSKTVCPSGLRGWTQVPLARAAWAQIPQLSVFSYQFLRIPQKMPRSQQLGRQCSNATHVARTSKTVCPSGLRGWTQVPLAQAAWVQIPQLSIFSYSSCRSNRRCPAHRSLANNALMRLMWPGSPRHFARVV